MTGKLVNATSEIGKRGYMPPLWWTTMYYKEFNMTWQEICSQTLYPLIRKYNTFGCYSGVIYVSSNFHIYRISCPSLILLYKGHFSLPLPIRHCLNSSGSGTVERDPVTGFWTHCYNGSATPILLEPVTKLQLRMESLWA